MEKRGKGTYTPDRVLPTGTDPQPSSSFSRSFFRLEAAPFVAHSVKQNYYSF
jgi:hypothetical protein